MGNPTVSYNKQFMWTGRQLTLAETIDGTLVGYSYNADGIRTQKDVCDVVTEYFLQGSTILAEKTGSNVIWYIYDTAGDLLGFTYNGTPYYYLKNMQGDVYKVVDANGTVVASYTYDPWGKVLTATGSMAQINPIRYRSYYYDSETGLYYLQSRYYDPELGRFINADVFVATGQGLIGNNMFAYCNNNPLLYKDSGGFKLELADDATEEQKEQYHRALAYLMQSETARELIELLKSSETTFTIVFEDSEFIGETSYNSLTKTICFDPYAGTLLGDGMSVQSAALGLVHEMGHAAQDLDGLIGCMTRDALEEQNLETYETPIATELGEPIRNGYYDAYGPYKMKNSTHFRTAIIYPNRPRWHYICFWKLFKPHADITNHNST